MENSSSEAAGSLSSTALTPPEKGESPRTAHLKDADTLREGLPEGGWSPEAVPLHGEQLPDPRGEDVSGRTTRGKTDVGIKNFISRNHKGQNANRCDCKGICILPGQTAWELAPG